jgi:hypothetical protein
VDVAPKQKTTPCEKVARLVRLLSTTTRGERVAAWQAIERTMNSEGISWSDVGNWIERGGKPDMGEYSEDDLLQFGQAQRAEGVEAGIKIGMARKSNGNGKNNGHITLPQPAEMAEFCHDRLSRLKDDKQREFVSDIYVITRRGMSLSLGRLGYLVSIYIQHGGRI